MNEDQANGKTASEEEDVGEVPSNKLKAELEKAKNDYLYLLAEFDNYCKNAIKERSELVKYGSERFIRDFLGVFDDFERALETDAKSDNWASFREGVQMIATELKNLLNRFGVEELKCEGAPFDPSKHEALGSEPRSDIPAGHISRVIKKPYKMHDKLIRPAQVTVSAGSAKGESQTSSEQKP
jgi:molecular chaperone GrpE